MQEWSCLYTVNDWNAVAAVVARRQTDAKNHVTGSMKKMTKELLNIHFREGAMFVSDTEALLVLAWVGISHPYKEMQQFLSFSDCLIDTGL